MKKTNPPPNSNFLKKIFIKICRILGYEIIDQSNFFVPTQEKKLDENLSIQGKKSINLPLGEIKISRKVNALTIIFRSCTKVNMLTQSKKRLFDSDKSEIKKNSGLSNMEFPVTVDIRDTNYDINSNITVNYGQLFLGFGNLIYKQGSLFDYVNLKC